MRNLVLGIGFMLAFVALAWLAGRGGGAGELEALRGNAGALNVESQPASRPSPALEPDRSSAVDPEGARLDVRVVDQDGGPLDDARIVLALGAERFEARGRACSFDDLVSGTATLTIEHAAFPTWERTVALSPGELRREVVQLRADLDLYGRVMDRFGAPRAGMQVWFLRPEQRHPMDAEATRSLVSAISDRDGRIRATLPETGDWRLSVGRVAVIETSSEPRAFTHGGADTFDIVIPGTTRLEVLVEWPATPEPLTAIVMGRTEDLRAARDDRKNESELAREKRLDEAFARGLPAAPPPGDPPANTTPDPSREAPEWGNRQSRKVPNDGRVIFTSLPPDEEMRIAIVRPGERYESNTSLSLRPDQRIVARVTVPPAGAGTTEIIMPLALSWGSEPLPADVFPAGIHWRNR